MDFGEGADVLGFEIVSVLEYSTGRSGQVFRSVAEHSVLPRHAYSSGCINTRKLLRVQHCEHLPVHMAEDCADEGGQA